MSSCIGDNYAIVKHFVEHSCDINSGCDSNTLLIMAYQYGHEPLTK